MDGGSESRKRLPAQGRFVSGARCESNQSRRAILGRGITKHSRARTQCAAGGEVIFHSARGGIHKYKYGSDVRAAGSNHAAVALDFGKNNQPATRTYLRLLSDLRGGHGIFPPPGTRRVPRRSRRRRTVLRNDDVDLAKRGLRTLRNLELRAARLLLGTQQRVLGRPRLSWDRSKRIFNSRVATLAERF